MNRPIKFRAWDKDNESMREVTDLNFYDEMVYVDENAGGDAIPILLEDIELMQFTGLKDKNGKEIYEGDIVDVGPQWWNDDVDHDMHTINDSMGTNLFYSGDWSIEPEEVEVIGNIYENPALLKDKK